MLEYSDMAKVKHHWNIAFEISPLLTASGSFGDKSGVFRYMYGLLIALITELEKKDPEVKILLFTFAPHNLNYAVSPDLLELIENDEHVTMVGYKRELKTTIPRYSKIFDFLAIPGLKHVVKVLDNIFQLRELYNDFATKRQFRAYVKSLTEMFHTHKIQAVFHSETGFFPLRNLVNIITIYDLTPILFPELHRPATVDLHLRKIKFAKNQADIILAISESTRRDLLAHCQDFQHKSVVVAYPGLDPNFGLIKKSEELDVKKMNDLLRGSHTALTAKRYLLFYGTFEPRKNITYAVQAFTELYRERKIPRDFKFVLIGGNGWGKTKDNILSYIEQHFPLLSERPIIVLDYATDLHLRAYIKHARAVLYPSLYEGFGLPVLESMALGTPVLTSNTSSLPEVGGHAALYINPKNYFELKKQLQRLIEDDELVADMSKKGLVQSRKFTWENTVATILDALDNHQKLSHFK